MIDKRELLDRLVGQIMAEREALVVAAKAAREAATHEESKPEDQYDTRGLEASYLAGAQAARATELDRAIAVFRGLDVREWKDGEAVAAGALVELLSGDGRKAWYFIVPQGGGLTVSVAGQRIQTLTPRSPLGDELLGKRRGESVEVEMHHDEWREYEIVAVR